MKHGAAFLAAVAFAMALALSSVQAEDRPRALGRVVPLTAEQLQTESVTQTGSAGLFVGIGQFAAGAGLPDLNYTVDDAVALADAFVRELHLLTPEATRVALGGVPKSERGKQSLARLREAGVKITGADKKELLDGFRALATSANHPDGLILCSISTHGCLDGGRAYLFPADGTRSLVSETALQLGSIKRLLEAAPANKKVLIVDACRESRSSEVRSLGGLPPGFLDALKEARGLAVLMSCSDNQLSWEDERLQQGVFTHHLLEALRGGAQPDARGILRLGAVAKFAGTATDRWAQTNRGARQEPTFHVTFRADEIPLAYNADAGEEARKLAERRQRAKETYRTAQAVNEDVLSGAMGDALFRALNAATGPDLERLLEHIDTLKNTSASSADQFASWWRSAAPQFAARPAPEPTPLPLPVPAAANTPAPSPSPSPAPAANLETRRREALKLMTQAFTEDSAVISGALLDEVKHTLEKADPKAVEPLLVEVESLRDNTDRNRKAFARYWREEGRTFGQAAARGEDGSKTRTPGDTPTVDQVLDRYLEALGGRAALESVTTSGTTGTIEFHEQGVSGQMQQITRDPNRVLIQVQVPGITYFRSGFNGTQAWTASPLGFQLLTGEQLEDFRFEAALAPHRLKKQYVQLEAPKPVEVKGRACWMLRAERPNGRKDAYYFDAETHLLTRLDGMVETEAGLQPGSTYFEDYRTVNRLKTPFLRRAEVDGEPKRTFRLQRVEYNQPINDAIFNPIGF